MIELKNIDCIDLMKCIENNIIDLTVTSPPYDYLRDYGDTLEWNEDIFKNIANELFRITREGGVLVWIVGDSSEKGNESGTSFKQALYFKEIGFNLHDTMIYQKPPRGAVGSRNAYWQSFEYMFVFTKGKIKTFNPINDRKNKEVRNNDTFSNRTVSGEMKESNNKGYGEFGRRTNVWLYYTGKNLSTKDEIAFKHPAIFPESLAEDHIISWSNEGDIVFDPFSGSGTTAKMAFKNNRNFIGSEKNKEYYDISMQRLGLNESEIEKMFD